jgi:hypothetical protein
MKALYRKAKLDPYLEDDYFQLYGRELKERFEQRGVSVSMFF